MLVAAGSSGKIRVHRQACSCSLERRWRRLLTHTADRHFYLESQRRGPVSQGTEYSLLHPWWPSSVCFLPRRPKGHRSQAAKPRGQGDAPHPEGAGGAASEIGSHAPSNRIAATGRMAERILDHTWQSLSCFRITCRKEATAAGVAAVAISRFVVDPTSWVRAVGVVGVSGPLSDLPSTAWSSGRTFAPSRGQLHTGWPLVNRLPRPGSAWRPTPACTSR